MQKLIILCIFLFLILTQALFAYDRRWEQDVELDPKARERLDTFEHHTLGRADQSYAEQQWRQALAEYDAFILEFPRSKVLSYAILRKGRCLQNDGKMFKAIEQYNEVLDYFPNDIDYASAALFRIGECYWSNGDKEKAMKAWVEMANDKDYSQHYLAARAVLALADNLMKQDKVQEAIKYYTQVAVDFWKKNNDYAKQAYPKVFHYYVRTSPNEKKLREFVRKSAWTGRWDNRAEKLDIDKKYWDAVASKVAEYNQFDELQSDLQKKYLAYWASTFKSVMPEYDDLQIKAIDLQHQLDKDSAKRTAALDQQYQKYQKPDDYGRVIKFVRAFAGNKQKVAEYYGKMNIGKMTRNQMQTLISNLYDMGNTEQARHLVKQMPYGEMTDHQIFEFAREILWYKDQEIMPQVYARAHDRDAGKKQLLWYYYERRKPKEGLPVAERLTQVEKYAGEAWFKKGEFLRWMKQYEDAIKAYRLADNAPHNLWEIINCYVGLKDIEAALVQAREIENFFEDQAPRAAFEIAELHKRAGRRKEYVTALRTVLKKYPKSRESSYAHERLEKLGIRIGGGVDAD